MIIAEIVEQGLDGHQRGKDPLKVMVKALFYEKFYQCIRRLVLDHSMNDRKESDAASDYKFDKKLVPARRRQRLSRKQISCLHRSRHCSSQTC